MVDLTDQVLEEALQLLHGAVRGGQEPRRVIRAGLQPADLVELGHQLAPEALDPAGDRDGVAGLEAKPDSVDLAEHPRGQRAAPVAQLEREVDRAVPRRQTVLPGAGELGLQALTGAEVRDLNGRLFACGRGSGCRGWPHASIVEIEPDAVP